MNKLDVDFVRKQFPSFQFKEVAGNGFFENAGGSFMSKQVINRLNRFHNQRRVQPYWVFNSSKLAGDEMDESRSRLAALLNIPPISLHFGASTSQNTYVLANAFRDLKSDRKVIIVTNQDHEANTGVWRRLQNYGYIIKEWKVRKNTGSLDINDLKKILDEDVCLITFPHCSNIIGEINPVKEICELSKKNGSYTCVDGVSYVPHSFPNIKKLGCDIYMFSSYKTYGPHLGIMYVDESLNRLLPFQGHYFNAADLTKTLTPAGPDHAQIASVAGIVDYIEVIDKHHFKDSEHVDTFLKAERIGKLQREAESEILLPLLNFLKNKKGIKILGDMDLSIENKVPTISIDINGKVEKVVEKLNQKGLMAGSGDFYAVRLLEALGIELPAGVLRLSFVHYTSSEEVFSLIEELDQIL
ncbi:MAG: aminotransferase class V-fold PLP-dependent enzyme [Paracoccaceae bacterium]